MDTCVLQQLLADAEPSVRAVAKKLANQLHPNAAAEAGAFCIAARIDDDDEDIKIASIRALGEMGAAGAKHADEVAAMLSEEGTHGRVRQAAVESLSAMGKAPIPTESDHSSSVVFPGRI